MRLYSKLLTLGLMTAAVAACSKGEAEEPASEPTEAEPEAAPEEEPAAEPAPEAQPAEPAAAAAEPAGFDGAKVTRYVTSFALNVRTGPGKDFPVKRHVKRGDKVEVVVNGEWAKLDNGEYVSTNRLTDKAPKH